ncbi:hypothetical protein H0H93_011895 [Arthromyces matolae]|nr:hypothetical protein H0H93_011895 [Arthromyces matolae]
MDSWPAAHRARTTESNKNRISTKASSEGYPEIDVGAGGPNVLTLVQRDGRLEWSSLLRNSNQVKPLRPGKSTVIFPATRRSPDPVIKSSTFQSAERGANFLRTYLPDVDVPAEIIRDELSKDAKIMEDFETFDPYMGNLLQTVVVSSQAYLAFPMGELNRDLNVSPFQDLGKEIVFKPFRLPVRTFDTPIQQIVASSSQTQAACISVRTFGKTSFFEVDSSKSMPSLNEITTVSHPDTGERGVVDMTIFHEPFSALLVNDFGEMVYSAPENDIEDRDFFWRLACGPDDKDYLLASKSSLCQIDVRCNDVVQLFAVSGKHSITSVEDQRTDYIVKLCSTREIVWIDNRFTKKPLLAYTHGRQYDRHLEMADVVDFPLQLYGHPVRHETFASYPGHALHSGADTFSLIRLDGQGSLHKVDLSRLDDVPDAFGVFWTADVKELETQPLDLFEPAYASQTFAETDLSEAYNQIFCFHERERAQTEEENADAVYDLLESLPTFWQGLEHPMEHIITMYDAILQSGDDPTQSSRSDYLGESVVNSTRGYRALVQGRLSPTSLINGATWHKNITPALQRLDPTFPDIAQSGIEAFNRYDLADSSERSPLSMRYEKEAREQLALDLALSADVFSSQPFSRFQEEGLEALRNLSLASEPPPMEFGYLQPKITDHYIKDRPEQNKISMGVRSLLKEWQIYADPEKYVFVDRYDGDLTAPQPIQPTDISPTQDHSNRTPSQRPPTIVPARTALPTRPPELRRTFARSQPDLMGMPRLQGFGRDIPLSSGVQTQESSQDLMMSTQVLPGLHGGRPALPKRKWKRLSVSDMYVLAILFIAVPRVLCRHNVTVDDQDSSIVYNPRSSWTLSANSSLDVGGAHMLTQDPSATATFTFTGVAVYYMAPLWPYTVNTAVSLDHGPAILLDLVDHSRANTGQGSETVQSQVIWGSEELSNTPHTLVISVGTGQPYAVVDAFITPNPLYDPAALHDALRRNRAVLDSLKSRLQTIKTPITIPKLAGIVYREEGIMGFYRGLWIPLMTISFVRAASFTIYTRTKESFRDRDILCRDRILDVALTGGAGGAMSGALISFTSCPFELVKIRRQLEYSIAASKGVHLTKPPGTLEAVRETFRTNGFAGLYTGFRLHLCKHYRAWSLEPLLESHYSVRDTAGTALYFLEYDGMRHLLGRKRNGEQGPTPSWLPIPQNFVPFFCGSLSGVTSWALIYPLDVVKTKVQQRALSGEKYRGVFETLHRLIRGPDPNAPKPLLMGLGRIYRGLGVSAVRSITTHGLLWTLFDMVGHYIDNLPHGER